ncbi:MAG TPA: hypothetical protein VFY00_06520 [Arenimonas sp.]|nr:hypothetical protein [Arenimonas sp.]
MIALSRACPASLALLAAMLCVAPCAARAADVDAAFTPVDPASLAGPGYYDAKRFPHIGGSVFHPDAALLAPVRAVLMVDAQEGELAHARYRVRYHLAPPESPELPEVAEVEVIRLNLGPAFRSDLIAQDPALPVAPVEAFGAGPHVAYRFRMGPVQGLVAAITAVERRELDDAEAATLSCLDMPCLALAPGPGPGGDWTAIPGALPELPFAVGDQGEPAAAAIVGFLLDALGEDARLPVPRSDAHRFEFVVSHNAFGQDRNTLGLGRDTVVLDDAIGTLWVRWRQVGEAAPDASLMAVPR